MCPTLFESFTNFKALLHELEEKLHVLEKKKDETDLKHPRFQIPNVGHDVSEYFSLEF